MELLVVAVLAVAGMIWAFLRGKDTQKRDDMQGEVERKRKRDDEILGGAQGKIDEIDQRIEDGEDEEITVDDAINILRDRYGWHDDA
jgi:preprotein translocase subunit YajC